MGNRRLGVWPAFVVIGAAQLAGCASFSGVPYPVNTRDSVVDLATAGRFSLKTALDAAADVSSTDHTKEYRDAYIGIQMAALDAQYFNFRMRLSAQAKTANFGLDLGILGLTSGGAIASERVANILSAGGAGLTGAKASLNKEVYFEKALPALIASMDTQRILLKTQIVDKMQRSLDQYSIAEAITDVAGLELSASLDGAIEQITASATAEKAKAQREYKNLVPTCKTLDAPTAAVLGSIAVGVQKLKSPADDGVMASVSDAMKTDRTLPFAAQQDAVITKLGTSYCTKADADLLAATLTDTTGGKVP